MAAVTDAEMLRKSVGVLTEQAKTAAALAKDQRKTADEQSETARIQHMTAHRLEDLSSDLAKGAAELKKNLAGKPK
jgi:hypothetical protein